MSTSSFSKIAAPLWPKRLMNTFHTIRLDNGEKMKKIKEELDSVNNLLSAVEGREQIPLHHFADLNFHLRKVIDYGNANLMLELIDSSIREIESKRSPHFRFPFPFPIPVMVESNINLKGELIVLLKQLRGTIIENFDNHEKDPLFQKFEETEAKVKDIALVFLTAKQWEQQLLERFQELDHYKNFDKPNPTISDTFDFICHHIYKIEDLVGGLRGTQDAMMMAKAMNPTEALCDLRRRLELIFLNKNADKPLIDVILLEADLKGTMNTMIGVKQWEEKLATQLASLDLYLGRFGMTNIESLFKFIFHKLTQLCQFSRTKEEEEEEEEDHQMIEMKDSDEATTMIRTYLEAGGDPSNRRLQLRHCWLITLKCFPKDAVIKKRPLIYWWLGEGFIPTEDTGEALVEELLNLNFIIPYDNAESQSPVVNQFQIHPDVRHTLFLLGKKVEVSRVDAEETIFYERSSSLGPALAGTLVGEEDQSKLKVRTIFNLEERYLSFESKWLATLHPLKVLQLGRWHASREHHIHVRSEAILKGLGTQKHLKYLSLRGISGIRALPGSIYELTSLEILDLKACFNLEKLPPGIASLKKLTHLDISECYSLESMPEGLQKLSSLQVLKGFVIGYAKNYAACRIGDLARLQKLKRLSVYIADNSVIEDKEFERLKDLVSLRRLKISWEVVVVSQEQIDKIKEQRVSFPPYLEKLDLQGIPHEEMPEWLEPSEVRELKKLYIRGGKLSTLEVVEHRETDQPKYKVEILLLKYLRNLQIEPHQLQDMFPLLRYAEAKDLGRDDFMCRKGRSQGSTSKPELAKSAA